MSYTWHLVRLPAGVERDEAYRKQSEANQTKVPDRTSSPADASKERFKRRLADKLMARHPSLQLFQPDYAELAKQNNVDLSEARRRFRNVELNEQEHWIQIILFDDEAGASFAFTGSPQDCTKALRLLWDCLRTLESEGGFSTYDPQLGRVLNLDFDFDAVLKTACGVDRPRA